MFEAVAVGEDKISLDSLVNLLSPREFDVLALMSNGDSNSTIRDKLDFDEITIKNVLASIYEKLSIKGNDDFTPSNKAVSIYRKEFMNQYYLEELNIRPLKLRQYEALSLLSQGYSVKKTAKFMKLKDDSVKKIWHRIYVKFGITNNDDINPGIVAMLRFDRLPKPEGYKSPNRVKLAYASR